MNVYPVMLIDILIVVHVLFATIHVLLVMDLYLQTAKHVQRKWYMFLVRIHVYVKVAHILNNHIRHVGHVFLHVPVVLLQVALHAKVALIHLNWPYKGHHVNAKAPIIGVHLL